MVAEILFYVAIVVGLTLLGIEDDEDDSNFPPPPSPFDYY